MGALSSRMVSLQRLKGQGLALRWFGFEAESGDLSCAARIRPDVKVSRKRLILCRLPARSRPAVARAVSMAGGS